MCGIRTRMPADADWLAHCHSALADTWRDEWNTLTLVEQYAIVLDFATATEAVEMGSLADWCDEYQRRIWRGNLAKYASTVRSNEYAVDGWPDIRSVVL